MTENILNIVFSVFGKENILTVIHYGNKNGRDIDVFVVLSGEIECDCVFHGKMDIAFVGGSWVKKMIDCFDPRLTEPVLTGEFIYGEQKIVERVRRRIKTKETVEYLREKAFQFLEWGMIYFQNGDLPLACDCIRFSVSFHLFARHYKKSERVVVFSFLIDRFQYEGDLINRAERVAKEQEEVTREKVEGIFKEVFQLLTNG